MKKNSRIRAKKVRAKKFAAVAAYSRRCTVNNCTTGAKLKTVKIDKDTELKVIEQNGVMYYRAGWKDIFKTLHIAGNLYTVSEKPDDLGLHCHLVEPVSWKHKKYPQPKSYWLEIINTAPTRVESTSLHKDPVKMNRTQYMEKLMEHKLARWERKNPCPIYSPDLFYSQEEFNKDVEKWKKERELMKERFRDFVVSIYDKLIIMGNRVKPNEFKTKASKIAEVKDVDGKGHDVSYPNLSEEDKLYKNAESAAKKAMKKDASIIDADLMNHKRSQKRPLLGAKRVTLADKRLKKAA